MNSMRSLSLCAIFILSASLAHAADQWESVTPSGTNGYSYRNTVSINEYVYLATDHGVYRSTDYGVSWTQINTGLVNLDVRAIAIGWTYDSSLNNFAGGYAVTGASPVIVATADGVYTSTLASSTWASSTTGLTDTNVYDVEYDAYEIGLGYVQTLYVATPSGVFRSDDLGVTWTLQDTGMTGKSVEKISTEWLNGNIFAATADNQIYSSSLYSLDYATNESWASVFSGGATTTEDISVIEFLGGVTWLATNNGILKSDGTGSNWQLVTSGLGAGTVHTVSSDYADSNVAYAAVEGGGVYRTTNEALTDPNWLPINKNLSDLAISDVRTNAGSSTLIYATGASGVYKLELSAIFPYPDLTEPSAISNLTASTTSTTTVLTSWTEPGDDLDYGTTTSYEVRYATSSPITEGNWASTTLPGNQPTPHVAGSAGQMQIQGLVPGNVYYFAVKTTDEAGNTSSLSNVATSATDWIDPTVNITTPSNGTTVSGTSLSVTANASDDVDVVGVQFKLDGVNLGSEDTSAPYTITWNTTGSSDGSHVLTAVARDNVGNSKTSVAVSVTVSNNTGGGSGSSGGGGGGGGGGSSADIDPLLANHATNIALTPTLAWETNDSYDSFSVYVSDDASISTSDLVGTTSNTSLTVSDLKPNTRYYWRVDIVLGNHTERGRTWRFTTGDASSSTGNDTGTPSTSSTAQWIHTYTNTHGHSVSSYHQPFFTYLGITAMLMKVYATDDYLILTAGVGSKLLTIDKTFYVYSGGTWVPLEWHGIWPEEYGKLRGKAYYFLRKTDPMYTDFGFFIAQMDMRFPGCIDSPTCAIDSGWRLQGYDNR